MASLGSLGLGKLVIMPNKAQALKGHTWAVGAACGQAWHGLMS